MKAKIDSERARVLELVKRSGVLRPRDLAGKGISRITLSRLVKDGHLKRPYRGLYILRDTDVTEHHTLAQAARRFPEGVVCLLSALLFHDLTTQLPHEVWLAIPPKTWQPKRPELPVRFIRFSGKAFTEGVDQHVFEKVCVRIYNAPKTVADCFKFRNKVGLDVAMEALRDCLRQRKATVDELMRYAKICRVAKVMSPYIEAMLS
ncbi:MAG: type IV toxin-antitoxin system AbiEi family antitoxin domain-containing protein [Planctomycetota bacterium]